MTEHIAPHTETPDTQASGCLAFPLTFLKNLSKIRIPRKTIEPPQRILNFGDDGGYGRLKSLPIPEHEEPWEDG